MLHAAREEDERAGLGFERLAGAAEGHGAVEDVEDLVFGRVGVVAGLFAGARGVLDERETASGRELAGLDDEVGAEAVGPAFAGLQGVGL